MLLPARVLPALYPALYSRRCFPVALSLAGVILPYSIDPPGAFWCLFPVRAFLLVGGGYWITPRVCFPVVSRWIVLCVPGGSILARFL